MRVLVGGVGELLQGDLDVGRLVADRLQDEDLGPHVAVEDISYGAVAVAQRIDELELDGLVVIGAAARGQPPGTVTRHRIAPDDRLTVDVANGAIRDAVTGYVSAQLVIDVAGALGSRPARTVLFEVEPHTTAPGDPLSNAALRAVAEVVTDVRAEVRRMPLLALADVARAALSEGRLAECPLIEAVRELLADLDHLDRTGRWGGAFRTRDRVRLRIAEGASAEGAEGLDWALWWSVIEELDRLEAAEAAG